jgi:acyl-CoA thioester hydrolase
MCVGDDDERMAQHGAKDGPLLLPPQPCGSGGRPNVYNPERPSMPLPAVSEMTVRVNYSETDQMGVVYHARYLVWLDVARTEHLRLSGASYRELEAEGLRLAVSDVTLRFRQPARFDDLLRIRCWVRDLATRRVEFGYVVEHADEERLLATATIALMALGRDMRPTTLPPRVREVLRVVPDPVRLGLATEATRAPQRHRGLGE